MRPLFIALIIFAGRLAAQQDTLNKEPIYTVVEVMPEYPGGMPAMSRYIMSNLHYPASAREAGISGKHVFKFIINKDGSISNVETLVGLQGCPDCDREAIRVLSDMPRWKPGRQEGQPVRTWFTMPLSVHWQ